MATVYTSALIAPVDGLVDVEIDQINVQNRLALEVSRYSAQEELVGVIVPPTTYIENGGCAEGKTRVRVYLAEGQLQSGEKIQFKIDSL
jgi:hypothetical protein